MAFTRVFFKILLPGRHSLGGRELEATGILNFSPSLYMYIIYVVIYYIPKIYYGFSGLFIELGDREVIIPIFLHESLNIRSTANHGVKLGYPLVN